MERVFKDVPPFQLKKSRNQPIKEAKSFLQTKADFPFVWSKKEGRGPGLNNTGTKHQSIIKDPNLLQSLNDIIRGLQPNDLPENGNVVVSSSSGSPSNGFESSTEERETKISFGNQKPGPGEHPGIRCMPELREGGASDRILEADVEGKYSFEYKSKELDSGFESLVPPSPTTSTMPIGLQRPMKRPIFGTWRMTSPNWVLPENMQRNTLEGLCG